MRITRRYLQIAIGLLWLADGLLQLQPFMFTTGFAHQILAPAGDGQPGWIAGPGHYFATHFAQHPAALNSAAAAAQLALGVGFLLRRTVRVATVASIAWSVGLWWFAEGLGGLASAHASLLTGAPGAAILYGVLAAGCWPQRTAGRPVEHGAPARGLRWAWTTIWLGGATLQMLPAQNNPNAVADQIRASADGAPGWIAATDRTAAAVIAHTGTAGLALAAAGLAAVGLGALFPGRTRTVAAYTGAGLAALFWLLGQNLGQLYTGHATDPNTGVLLILLAAAIASTEQSVRAKTIPDARPAPRPRPRGESVHLTPGPASPAHVHLPLKELTR